MESRKRTSAWTVTGKSKRFDYKGMREASGAIAFPKESFEDCFLVVSNEDNHLRLYAVGNDEEILPRVQIAPRGRNDIDLEAGTWLNGRAVFAGSFGRNGDGEPRPARQNLVSIELTETKGGVRNTGRVLKYDGLLPALAELDPSLRKAIGSPDTKCKKLAPKKHGINLEGLSAAADGTSLMLGFRNPLKGKKALIVKFRNAEAILDGGEEKPKLGPLYELSLGGLGVRSLDYSKALGAYVIVAGPVGSDDDDFDIFLWKEGGKPKRIAGAAKKLRKLKRFSPEGLIVDETGTQLRLFGDNGGSKKGKRFPSVVLTIAQP